MRFINLAGYKFVPLERLPELKARLKESVSSYQPFKRILVKIRKEIITLRVPGLDPAAQRAPAVTPAELKRWLDGNLKPELAGAQ